METLALTVNISELLDHFSTMVVTRSADSSAKKTATPTSKTKTTKTSSAAGSKAAADSTSSQPAPERAVDQDVAMSECSSPAPASTQPTSVAAARPAVEAGQPLAAKAASSPSPEPSESDSVKVDYGYSPGEAEFNEEEDTSTPPSANPTSQADVASAGTPPRVLSLSEWRAGRAVRNAPAKEPSDARRDSSGEAKAQPYNINVDVAQATAGAPTVGSSAAGGVGTGASRAQVGHQPTAQPSAVTGSQSQNPKSTATPQPLPPSRASQSASMQTDLPVHTHRPSMCADSVGNCQLCRKYWIPTEHSLQQLQAEQDEWEIDNPNDSLSPHSLFVTGGLRLCDDMNLGHVGYDESDRREYFLSVFFQKWHFSRPNRQLTVSALRASWLSFVRTWQTEPRDFLRSMISDREHYFTHAPYGRRLRVHMEFIDNGKLCPLGNCPCCRSRAPRMTEAELDRLAYDQTFPQESISRARQEITAMKAREAAESTTSTTPRGSAPPRSPPRGRARPPRGHDVAPRSQTPWGIPASAQGTGGFDWSGGDQPAPPRSIVPLHPVQPTVAAAEATDRDSISYRQANELVLNLQRTMQSQIDGLQRENAQLRTELTRTVDDLYARVRALIREIDWYHPRYPTYPESSDHSGSKRQRQDDDADTA